MRVVVYAPKETTTRLIQALQPFGILVKEHRSQPGEIDSERDEFGPVDAALFELESLARDKRREGTSHLQHQGVCVVGIAGPNSRRPWQDYSEEELDGVVSADCSPAALACALWSAHRQFELRRVLGQRIEELELTFERRKRIEQAKSVLAEMMNISEAEALRHLRREARNRRRPMHEMAHIVIEARELFRVPNGQALQEANSQTATVPLRT